MNSVIDKFLSLINRNHDQDPVKIKFTKVFNKNLFLGNESRSGVGSGLAQTAVIREELPKLLKQLRTLSLIDAPCGDQFWISKIELPVEKYIGIDIVHELIVKNNKKYANHQRSYLEKNIIEDELPKADVILCRDCLVHLSYAQCFKVINNFKKSGSKYLLTTTYVNRKKNTDLGRGFWRTLNLDISPFHFPKPIAVINEKCTEINGEFADKCLSLWLLDDIHFFE